MEASGAHNEDEAGQATVPATTGENVQEPEDALGADMDDEDGDDDEESDNENGDADTYIPVIQDGRQITFKLGTLSPFIVCTLCDGYLVDATTITECMHTFCKSCIYKFLTENDFCPICQQNLGGNPMEQLRKDSAIQTIVYKLVPGLQKRVDDDRETFDKAHGIKRQAEEGESAPSVPMAKRPPAVMPVPSSALETADHVFDEQISFQLRLDEHWVMSHKDANERIPPEKMAKLRELDRPYIRTSARATVLTLKKFLLSKLKFDSPSDLDICLNGEILGQELSLEFVQKTRAIDSSEQLVLRYRPNVNLL